MPQASDQAPLYELSTYGKQDKHLMSKTFDMDVYSQFRQLIVRHSANIREPVKLNATSQTPAFNIQGVEFKLPTQYDVITNLIASSTIPAIGFRKESASSAGTYQWFTPEEGAPHWHDAILYRIMNEIRLCFQNSKITYLNSLMMFAWEEISGKPGKLHPEQIGKASEVGGVPELQDLARHTQVLHGKVPFWFVASTYVAFPSSSLHYSVPTFEVDFASIEDCVCAPEAVSGVRTSAWTYTDTTIYVRPDYKADTDTASAGSAVALKDSDLKFHLEAWCAGVEDEERDNLMDGHFDYLCTFWKHLPKKATGTSDADVDISIPLTFNLNVRELLWTVRRQDRLSNTVSGGARNPLKNTFHLHGFYDDVSKGYFGAVKSAKMTIGSYDRVMAKHGNFFWHAANDDGHSRVSRHPVYCLPFGFELEGINSHGSAGLGLLDDKFLELTIDANTFGPPVVNGSGSSNTSVTVDVMARMYQTIHCDEGKGRFRFQ